MDALNEKWSNMIMDLHMHTEYPVIMDLNMDDEVHYEMDLYMNCEGCYEHGPSHGN